MDTAIGVLFTAVFALGVLLMSRTRTYMVDLQDFLFGNVLSSTRRTSLSSRARHRRAAAHLAFYKELLFASFDPLMAQASGLPTVALSNLLLVIIAVTIIVSLQAAGIVLVAALLVTPAATAYQLTESLRPDDGDLGGRRRGLGRHRTVRLLLSRCGVRLDHRAHRHAVLLPRVLSRPSAARCSPR